MATTVSAWGKPGAWALDSEENEEMLRQEQQKDKEDSSEPSSDFPSLAAAAASKPSKKKKGQTLTLAEFNNGKPVAPGSGKFQVRAASRDSSAYSKGLTSEELLMLPTGPRERTAEELERASSRGFSSSSYGTGGGRPRMTGGEDSVSRWGSSRVSDDPHRGGDAGFDRDRDLAPSRADEIDDWGAAKRSAPPLTERRERTGGFFGSQSRADETDNWVSNKSSALPLFEGRRAGDGYRERRGGFEMFNKDLSDGGSGLDSDTWGRKRDVASGGRPDSDTWGRKREEASGGRPRLVLQQRSVPLPNENEGHQVEQQQGTGARSRGSNPFGAARPREEVLSEKGQDWKKIDGQLESMKIREVGSAHGERPNENGGHHTEPLQVTVTRSKVSNPFGVARPREEVLAEKGQDWKKNDEQLESKIWEVGSAQGERQPFEKRGFGTGNRQAGLPEDKTERNWRKMESTDAPASPPRTTENVEEGDGSDS